MGLSLTEARRITAKLPEFSAPDNNSQNKYAMPMIKILAARKEQNLGGVNSSKHGHLLQCPIPRYLFLLQQRRNYVCQSALPSALSFCDPENSDGYSK